MVFIISYSNICAAGNKKNIMFYTERWTRDNKHIALIVVIILNKIMLFKFNDYIASLYNALIKIILKFSSSFFFFKYLPIGKGRENYDPENDVIKHFMCLSYKSFMISAGFFKRASTKECSSLFTLNSNFEFVIAKEVSLKIFFFYGFPRSIQKFN